LNGVDNAAFFDDEVIELAFLGLNAACQTGWTRTDDDDVFQCVLRALPRLSDPAMTGASGSAATCLWFEMPTASSCTSWNRLIGRPKTSISCKLRSVGLQ
jgi:hypothetical protein